jgi:peptide-methionine (S)-S-oxide reductase
VTKLPGFYAAEDYHQNYATLHPHDPYIMVNDAPKVANLRTLFPELYVANETRR